MYAHMVVCSVEEEGREGGKAREHAYGHHHKDRNKGISCYSNGLKQKNSTHHVNSYYCLYIIPSKSTEI